jgi:hypothetical protein
VRFPGVASAVACLLFLALVAAGCGGSSDGGSGNQSVSDQPAPPASDFPSPKGKTLADVLNSTDGPAQVVVSPASQVFYKGPNRYSFGVFTLAQKQIPDAKVALYFAKVPPSEETTLPKGAASAGTNAATGATGATGKAGATGQSGQVAGSGGGQSSAPPSKAQARALDQPATGPFPARIQSLETEGAFRALTTANDPHAATAVYVTNVNFPSNGEWRIAAVIKDSDGTTATLLPSAIVGQFTDIPNVGQRPPAIHTPTPASVGGDLSKLTTRVPPETMNQDDFASVLGKKPIVLLFATPQFCQSRVCGPVVDIAEQVRQQMGDDISFIHMEIYNDNDPSKGVRPQVRAFHLPSEPWLFVIDRKGIIRTRIEGAFGLTELENAVKQVSG